MWENASHFCRTWKFDGLALNEAGLSSSNCYSTNEAKWQSNAILATASPMFHQLKRRETTIKGGWMTLRLQTLPELRQTLYGAKYLAPSCFHLILYTQFCSHLGLNTAVSTSMAVSTYGLLLIETDYFNILSGMLRLKCLACLSQRTPGMCGLRNGLLCRQQTNGILEESMSVTNSSWKE